MKNKEQFIEALSTLTYSWGSDTPPEAIWGINELLDWVELEYNTTISLRLEEDGENLESIIEDIRNI